MAEVTAPSRVLPRGTGRWSLRVLVVLYVGVLVLFPVVLLAYRALEPGLGAFFDAFSSDYAMHAFQLTAQVAGIAVVLDTVFGVAAAVLLTRYRFPGRRLLDAFIDLPIAISPIVVGLALLLVFSSTGWLGPTASDLGIEVIGSVPGMVLATVFVSLPLVVRSVVPVLEQAGIEQEQAAASLGANAVAQFIRITLPTIRAAVLYGVVLTLARCIGEYGAVLVVSGNFEGETETAPLRVGNLIQNDFDEKSAYAIAFVLMLVSILAIVITALLQRRKDPS
jgi:sulfate transport system permease protein